MDEEQQTSQACSMTQNSSQDSILCFENDPASLQQGAGVWRLAGYAPPMGLQCTRMLPSMLL